MRPGTTPISVAVHDVAMITPIGLSADQTLASLGAGIDRFAESGGATMSLLPEAVLPTEATGEKRPARWSRILSLLKWGLGDLAGSCQRLGPLPLYLGAAESETPESSGLGQWLLSELEQACDVDIRFPDSHVFSQGRAAGLVALHEAVEAIRRGSTNAALVAGADSFLDRGLIERLNKGKRLKTEEAMDGFIPAEGVGVLLVGRADLAGPVLAEVLATAVGFETGHLESTEPYKGEGLDAVFKALLNGLSDSDIKPRDVYSGMNGEGHWAKELAVSGIRSKARLDSQWEIHHPADCLGDLGAASGPVLAGIAARRSTSTPNLPNIITCSSDLGVRAAVLLNGVHQTTRS